MAQNRALSLEKKMQKKGFFGSVWTVARAVARETARVVTGQV